jgi:hypothetical protein
VRQVHRHPQAHQPHLPATEAPLFPTVWRRRPAPALATHTDAGLEWTPPLGEGFRDRLRVEIGKTQISLILGDVDADAASMLVREGGTPTG